ncbi:MAG: TolC family protein [Deltaproteobacteria bacterium]|nr:TolC family protein [Deltaproteobacteria bacterium]
MKHCVLVLSCSLLWGGQSWAIGIQDLLEAATRQPGYNVSALSIQESGLQQERATAALFPKLGLFGRFESYNSPTNLRPVPPTEVIDLAGDSLPFSREILRYGLNFDAPVYVHELYVLRRKADLLRQKAETDRQLDLLGRQAAVVSLNSALIYLQGLEKAIEARHASLSKTLEDMALKVKTGRSPESELLKIQKTLNDLDQQRNELTVKRLDTLREIQALTGIELTEPALMTLVEKPGGTAYLPEAAAQFNADAAQKEVERRRAARFPTLSVTGFLSGNEGEAYNTDSHIFRSYNLAALVLKFPLFDHTLSTDEAIARVQAEKAHKQLAQTRIDAAALADALDRKIPIIEKSIDLAQKSIADSETLLSVAQVAVRSGRMTLEDYLRYESDVLAAQAVLYQAHQQRWQVLSQQAALYGTDLKGIVK